MSKEKNEKKQELGLMYRVATIVEGSVNEAKRTVEVTFSSSTPVRMWSYDVGYFMEILSHEAGAVRMDRMLTSAPVLDLHDRWTSLKDGGMLGTVDAAEITGGVGKATLRFSDNPTVVPVWNDIVKRIIKSVSVGYNVYRYAQQPSSENETIPTYIAIDWEPYEISMVHIPADINAGVRLAKDKELGRTHDVFFQQTEAVQPDNQPANNNRTMTPEETALKAERKRVADIIAHARTANFTDQTFIDGLIADGKTLDESRTAIEAEAKRTAVPAPGGEVATLAERKRVTDITDSVRAAKIDDQPWLDKMIADGITADKAREMIIEKLRVAQPAINANTDGKVKNDESDKIRAQMGDALMLRANPDAVKLLKPEEVEAARSFRGMSLLRMAEWSLRKAGINTDDMSSMQIARTALGLEGMSRAYLTSSDFPQILGNTINRTLRNAYNEIQSTWEPIVRRRPAVDFRQMTVTSMGDAAAFKNIVEGGEYLYGAVGEGLSEKYQIAKYGRRYAFTWEMLINDDLSAFDRIPRMIASQAKQMQSNIVWGIFLSNPNMADAVALFHATHGNLAGSGAAISEATLSAARTAMRKQKSLGTDVSGTDNMYLNIVPKYLVVSPDRELEAAKFTSTNYVPTKQSDINPVYNTQLSIIVEPRLGVSLNPWYLVADPKQVDTIEVATLEGEGDLFTEQRIGFEVDGIETKARMTFGAKAIEYRSMYKNPGV